MKIYTPGKDRFIAYHKIDAKKNGLPTVIFCHGLMSDKTSSKGIALEQYCQQRGYGFIRFDNFGSGDSSGEFVEQNMSTWLEGLELVIDQLTEGKVIIVGSSMGGWLGLMAAEKFKSKVEALITIAAAPDFTERLVWDKLTKEQQGDMVLKGVVNVGGKDPNCQYVYPMSYQLIEDGRKHLMLGEGHVINIDCPVHLIHGSKDIDVPPFFSQQAAGRIKTEQVVLKLIKDGDHKLARPEDIQIIANSLEEILKII